GTITPGERPVELRRSTRSRGAATGPGRSAGCMHAMHTHHCPLMGDWSEFPRLHPADIVTHDEQDVGLLLLCGGRASQPCQRGEQRAYDKRASVELRRSSHRSSSSRLFTCVPNSVHSPTAVNLGCPPHNATLAPRRRGGNWALGRSRSAFRAILGDWGPAGGITSVPSAPSIGGEAADALHCPTLQAATARSRRSCEAGAGGHSIEATLQGE